MYILFQLFHVRVAKQINDFLSKLEVLELRTTSKP